jgi:hypothetical protein
MNRNYENAHVANHTHPAPAPPDRARGRPASALSLDRSLVTAAAPDSYSACTARCSQFSLRHIMPFPQSPAAPGDARQLLESLPLHSLARRTGDSARGLGQRGGRQIRCSQAPRRHRRHQHQHQRQYRRRRHRGLLLRPRRCCTLAAEISVSHELIIFSKRLFTCVMTHGSATYRPR